MLTHRRDRCRTGVVTIADVLLCVSLSHRTADFALLERLPDAADARRLAADLPQVRGTVPLATCNRLEFYLDVSGPEPTSASIAEARGPGSTATTEAVLQRLLTELSTRTRLPLSDLCEAARTMTGTRVAAHLFAVASGLDSVVLGEDEIAGQVRRSLQDARDQSSTSPALESLFQMAQSTSREVKNTTALNAAGRSLVRLGLDLAESRMGDWSRARVLLIGTGAYAAATWSALRERGVQQIQVASPSGREQVFAQRHGVYAVPHRQLVAALARADLVIAATRGRALGQEQLVQARPGSTRPLVIIDLGLPANVDREVVELPDVELLDLETISLHAPVQDLHAGAQARELIEAATIDFTRRRAIAAAGPVISAYRTHMQGVLEGELERLTSRGTRTPETERALRHFAGVLVHGPTARSRELAADGRLEEVAQAMRTLYGLEVPGAEAVQSTGAA